MSVVLEIDKICKNYGADKALSNVSLQLESDELFVILGPTGAGKTTLLRIISGLEESDAGDIFINGVNVNGIAPAQRDISFAFQNFALYPDWTVQHNLEFPLRAPGRCMAETEIRERINEVAKLLHIERLLQRPANNLSGGEMQRVAIGRCIVRRPSFFLMDEPLTNLDAKLREELRLELKLLQSKLKIPMLYVTHDQTEALSMADRIAVIHQGEILQIGSPENVYSLPKSPIVSRQLGQPPINLIFVQCLNGGWYVGDQCIVKTVASAEAKHGLLGVRPEHIILDGGRHRGKIARVEDSGPAWILHVEWLGQIVRALVDKTKSWDVGQVVYPDVDIDDCNYWPEEG
ncbi:MAG: ABC transporter ATP-binding protein [Candidatus Latescibacterota bacterium]|nr:ABC transporter ATP-binding protein [Candidatus Latescibacterota bacterium]